MSIQWLMLSALLSLAVWHDWRYRRIPNRLLLVFVAAAIVASLLPTGTGLPSALVAAMLGAGVFAPMYLLGKMGGGDIKLMATTGLLVGADRIASLCLAVALSGGVLAMVWFWRTGHLRHATDCEHSATDPLQERMPYAVAIATGTLLQGLPAAWHALAF